MKLKKRNFIFRREEAEERPKPEFVPKTLDDLDVLNPEPNGGDSHFNRKPGYFGNSMSNNYNNNFQSNNNAQQFQTNFELNNNQNLRNSNRQMYRSQGNLLSTNSTQLATSSNFKNNQNYGSDFWLDAWNQPTPSSYHGTKGLGNTSFSHHLIFQIQNVFVSNNVSIS